MELVCDNSELIGIWGAEVPDIIVIGGYAIERASIPTLLKRVQNVKVAHGLDRYCPIKWNLRDLDRALASHKLEGQQAILLAKSDPLRANLLSALTESGATLFASAILAHSNNKQILGETRQDLVGYSFGNLLMRAGLYCQEKAGGRRVDVLLDWPDRSDRTPFMDEYYAGWRHGHSAASEAVKYKCGTLAGLEFAPAPTFTGTEFEPRLQIADLVVGVTREFVNFALGKAPKASFGVQTFKTLIPNFYQDEGRVLGYGVTASPTHSDFSGAILAGLKVLRGNG
jgi:hypothetical protein